MKNTKKKVKLQLSQKPFSASRDFRIALIEQLLAYCDEHVFRPSTKDGILRYCYLLIRPEEYLTEWRNGIETYRLEEWGPYNAWDMVSGNGFRDMCYNINREFTYVTPDEDVTKYNMLPHIYELVT